MCKIWRKCVDGGGLLGSAWNVTKMSVIPMISPCPHFNSSPYHAYALILIIMYPVCMDDRVYEVQIYTG